MARELGLKVGIVESLDGAAEVAHAQGRAVQATRFFALATELRERYRMPRSGSDQTLRISKIATLRTVLGDEPFAAEWAAGCAVTLEQALERLDADGACAS